MNSLNSLTNSSRPYKKTKRVGRGIGSGRGKTSCRGEKGSGARSGTKARMGYEGGQFRTFQKMPIRGFSNARFRKTFLVVNLEQIEHSFKAGETVNFESLVAYGILSGPTRDIKILGDGEIKKKVKIEAAAYSEQAREKLQNAGITFTIV